MGKDVRVPGGQEKSDQVELVKDIKSEPVKVEVDPNKPISWQGNHGGTWQPRNGG